MTAVLYVEGGGNGKALRLECRKGFAQFIARAGLEGRMPRIVASGSRQNAFNDFCHALRDQRNARVPLLLVDSEGPVAVNTGAWAHLLQRDGWNRPDGAAEESAHLMVQCMEAWFLADRESLASFFGQGFNRNALPRRLNIEAIPKNDVLAGLKNATRQYRPKGEYGKAQHSFSILAETDPDHVLNNSPRARMLVDALLATIE